MIIVFASDNYLNLLNSNSKILYLMINSKLEKFKIFFNVLFKYFMPYMIVFLLSLNFYLAKICYLFFIYQFSLFLMNVSAIITIYGFSGAIVSLIIILPTNLIFFASLIYFSVICSERVELADRTKYFKEGFDRFFFLRVFCCLVLIILLASVVVFVFPMILKNYTFYIF